MKINKLFDEVFQLLEERDMKYSQIWDCIICIKEHLKDIENSNVPEFLDRCHYFYSKTNGTMEFPNSREGDLIKIMYNEITKRNKL